MKDAFADKLKAQIDMWSADIDHLEAEIKTLNADVRLKYQQSLNDLKERRDQALQRFEELNGASEESLDVIREGVVSAYNELVRSFKEAKNTFRELR